MPRLGHRQTLPCRTYSNPDRSGQTRTARVKVEQGTSRAWQRSSLTKPGQDPVSSTSSTTSPHCGDQDAEVHGRSWIRMQHGDLQRPSAGSECDGRPWRVRVGTYRSMGMPPVRQGLGGRHSTRLYGHDLRFAFYPLARCLTNSLRVANRWPQCSLKWGWFDSLTSARASWWEGGADGGPSPVLTSEHNELGTATVTLVGCTLHTAPAPTAEITESCEKRTIRAGPWRGRLGLA